MSSYSGNMLAQYESTKLFVKTNVKSRFADFSLSQSNLMPGMEAFYTIQLQTDTRLPSTAAFKIQTPTQIEIVRADKDDCYLDTNKIVKNRCYYQGSDTLEIRKAMRHFGTADYYGQVRIVFKAINPPSNFYEGLSLIVDISLDETFKYPIGTVNGGLVTSFECNYPCISCNPNNPNDCESCSEGDGKDYLQEDVITGTKTCKT